MYNKSSGIIRVREIAGQHDQRSVELRISFFHCMNACTQQTERVDGPSRSIRINNVDKGASAIFRADILAYILCEADGVKHGISFSAKIKTIAAQEPFADLQDRLVGLAEITERISLERKNIMVRGGGRGWNHRNSRCRLLLHCCMQMRGHKGVKSVQPTSSVSAGGLTGDWLKSS